MATNDLTTTLKVKPIDFDERQPVKWLRKRVNLAEVGGSAGDTYELIDIPAESAIVDGFVIVTTVFAAASSGTLTFKVGSAALSGAIDCNATAKGTCIRLFPNDYEDTAGSALYVTAADTVDVVNATAIPATGEFDLLVGYISVLDNT